MAKFRSSFSPKKKAQMAKFRKDHSKVRLVGISSAMGNSANSSAFVLRSNDYGFISAAAIESMRRSIRRKVRKSGRLLVKLSPHLTRTEKPVGVRMGKGKGTKVREKVCPLKPGSVIFQLEGLSPSVSISALVSASYKIGVSTRVTPLSDFFKKLYYFIL